MESKLTWLIFVEGEDRNVQTPAHWMDEVRITMNQEALESTLPHRGPEEQEEIRQCFMVLATA